MDYPNSIKKIKSSVTDDAKAGPDSPGGLLVVHRSKMFRQCLQSVLAKELEIDVQELDHLLPDSRLANELHADDILLIDVSLPDKAAIHLI